MTVARTIGSNTSLILPPVFPLGVPPAAANPSMPPGKSLGLVTWISRPLSITTR